MVWKIAHDVYGKPQKSVKARERCAVVRLRPQQLQSSVRADSSASRGTAQEQVAPAQILMTKASSVAIDDVVEVGGQNIKVTGVEPRYNVRGQLDHLEVTGDLWSAP